jgi:hypothetical protein
VSSGALPLCLLLAAAPFTPVGDRDGFHIETRPGARFEEIRVSGHVDATPEAFIAAAWGPTNDQHSSPDTVRREVLFATETERIYYELVKTPVVSDRDFVIHSRRIDDRATRVYEIRFQSETDARKPEVAGVVRMPRVEGSCVVSPAEGDGAEVVYTIYTDIGGSIAPWMVKNTLRTSAVEWVKTRLARAKASRR